MPNETYVAYGVVSSLVHLIGILSAFHSIMHTRTSQGAIAWSIALVTFPYFALPLYWILSRRKFEGYVQTFKSRNKQIRHIANDLKAYLPEYAVKFDHDETDHKILERLAALPFTHRNSADLLIDGDAAFDEMFRAIDAAKDYILAQFYIIKDDKLGCNFRGRLVAAAKRGVKVYVLYDEIGSYALSNSYIDRFKNAGIEIYPFKTAKRKSNRFQINFRNHRKIVITDGIAAYVGGLNVGDEYVGLDKRLSPWRDTHIKVIGPAVQCVQLTFIEDWYWATDSVPELNWTPTPAPDSDKRVLILSTGPADDYETCDLFFLSAINSAKQRVWIASPYFVPDPQMVSALQLAALRGVDVRVIFPQNWDRKFIWLAAWSFFEEIIPAGVKVYFYEEGFMHQKVMLIDDDISSVGTANFDNRSFRWNFEISVIVSDTAFTAEVEKMLSRDLKKSRALTADDLESTSTLFKFQVRVTRLFSQIL